MKLLFDQNLSPRLVRRLADRKGHLKHALYGVTPRGHAAEILGLLQGRR